MKKLSPTQLAILRRMAAGNRVERVVFPGHDHLQWMPCCPGPANPAATLPPLRRRSMGVLASVGFVEQGETWWWGYSYIISRAGHAYLEATCES